MTAFVSDRDGVAAVWGDAVRAVPRELFLPDRVWPFEATTGQYAFVNRTTDPDAWHAAVEADQPITTQWDDGHHQGDEPGHTASSSCSMPSLVLSMLEELDIRPGMRALEIGTGTGWNAGLLAHRLGDENVVTVEVDSEVAEQARGNLRRAGHNPCVVTGDGAAGWAPGAPYDRLVATCGLRGIPWAWVEQTRPGGIVLAPWGTHYAASDALARLTVAADGGSATGRFTQRVEFMKLRAQRVAVPYAEYLTGEWPHGADVTHTEFGPEVIDHQSPAAPFILGLAVPDCAHAAGEQGGDTVAWFYGLRDRSWAAARFTPGETGGEVYQYGPRRLWDEVEAAWRWWDAQGRPGIERFGLTVTTEGETVWLDSPHHPLGG